MMSLPISMIAMMSKHEHSAEEKQYTEQEQEKQKILGPQLLAACVAGKMQQVRRLLKDGADPNSMYAVNEMGSTPLHIATSHDSLEMVKLLVEHGADMEARDHQGNTPFFFACVPKENSIMEYMLDQGANINMRTAQGGTALGMACYNGDLKKVTLLLNKGVDINLANNQGKTALHAACKNKTPQIVNLLLARGADINAKAEGGTPLHFACFYENYAIVNALLKAGADYNIPSIYEFTPVDLACALNLNKIIALFVYYGAVVKEQEEADRAMHAFFAELKKESSLIKAAKNKQNIKNVVVQSQKKKPKKAQQKKEIISEKEVIELPLPSNIAEMSSEESPESQSIEPMYTETSTTSSTSTASATATIPKTVGESSKKEKLITEKENVYSVVEGPKLKWPRSLHPNQEKLIEKNIKALISWPEHGLSDVKNLKDQPGKFRFRVGGYRTVFSVDDKTHVITIETIGLRKNIYKKF
jgi:ankyrin repeat protein/mRNA-degrading endonuclease RelE of RelBE toxin-antitoxin system